MENKEDNKPVTVVEVVDQGPLEIKGNFILKDLKRGSESSPGEIRLCRCGKSKNNPFCDDSHNKKD